MGVLKVHALSDVPLTSGSYLCKWTLFASGKPVLKGETRSASLQNHRLVWDQGFIVETKDAQAVHTITFKICQVCCTIIRLC